MRIKSQLVSSRQGRLCRWAWCPRSLPKCRSGPPIGWIRSARSVFRAIPWQSAPRHMATVQPVESQISHSEASPRQIRTRSMGSSLFRARAEFRHCRGRHFRIFLNLDPARFQLKKINPDLDFFKKINPDPESYFRASRVLTQGYFCASRAFLLIFVNFVLFGAPIHHWCTKMAGVAPLRNCPLGKSPSSQLPTSQDNPPFVNRSLCNAHFVMKPDT